ncbi:MAG: hypothetical protein FD126_709, partial [Elusimicrobia bacterium]
TLADLERSTDAAAFARASSGALTSFVNAELLGCTSYWFRVKNVSGGGLSTAYAGPLNFLTQRSTPAAPSGLEAIPLVGRAIALTWNPSLSSIVTSYRVYFDSGTGTVNYSTPLAVVSSTVTDFETAPLTLGATYTFVVRTVNHCGVEDSTGAVAGAAADDILSEVKAVVRSPVSGRRISGDAVTLLAELTAGTDDEAGEVRFDYKPSSASLWGPVPAEDDDHPNPMESAPWAIHWDVDSLAAGSYDLRAVATDSSEVEDDAPAVVTVVVDPFDYDSVESYRADGTVSRSDRVDNAVTNTVRIFDDQTAYVAKVVLPPASLSGARATLSVVQNPANTPAAPAAASGIGAALEITLDSGQTSLSNGQTAAVSFEYPDANGDGVVDGTGVRADRLKMFTYDAVAGKWVREFATSLNASSRTITGRTPHFSFFALFAPAAAGLSDFRIYPSPYKPGGGNADEGRPFSAGDPNSGIVFDNLPADVDVEVFAVTGQRVTRFSQRGGTGRVQWDVRNEDGRDVASGVYVAVVSSPGQSAVVGKFAVIR